MKASYLKKELHAAIDRIDDESLLEAVYVILNKSTHDNILTVRQEQALYQRIDKHEKGLSKSIPARKPLKNLRENVFSFEQEQELNRRLDEDDKGLSKYISSKKSLKEIRSKLKK